MTIPMLEKLKQRIQSTGLFDVYVDVLDNIGNTDPQQYVMDRLGEADVFCVIQSNCINNSPWAQMEINAAVIKRIPKIQLTLDQIHRLLCIQADDALIAQLCEYIKHPLNESFEGIENGPETYPFLATLYKLKTSMFFRLRHSMSINAFIDINI